MNKETVFTTTDIVGVLEYIKELAAESEQSKKPDE